jgi:hypothetical protein
MYVGKEAAPFKVRAHLCFAEKRASGPTEKAALTTLLLIE